MPKLRWFGATLGLLLSVAAIVIASTLFAKENVRWKYSIVADAGSSHTSFILFNWPEDHMAEVIQIAECSTEGGEGIDKFVNKPDQIKAHFEPCLNNLAQKLEELGESDPKLARIYLGATAGMRLIKIMSEENSTRVMASIEKTFKESPFDYNSDDVKILTGQEEGAFSWITTNILAGTFNTTYSSSGGGGSDGRVATFGSLDMGGASMQIAYECSSGKTF